MNEVENAGFDKPSNLDWLYDELFWSEKDQRVVEYRFDVPVIHNQSDSDKTRMACTRYWMWHIIIAVKDKTFSPLLLRERYLEVNPKAEQEWATLQSMLAQAKAEKLIEWYVKLNTVEEAKDCISKWMLIYTGSLDGDWVSVRDDYMYRQRTDGKKLGHIFCWVGYNADGIRACNSYWPKNWYFFIPNRLWDTLYSRYAIIMTNEITQKEKAKRDEEAKELAYKYLMSDARPTDYMTREEFAIVAGRLLKLLWYKTD